MLFILQCAQKYDMLLEARLFCRYFVCLSFVRPLPVPEANLFDIMIMLMWEAMMMKMLAMIMLILKTLTMIAIF